MLPELAHTIDSDDLRHETVARQAERRGEERRGLAVIARRREEAERSHRRRQFLHAYFEQLPRMELLLWIDRLWLGNATDAQLALLEEVATAELSDVAADRASQMQRGGSGHEPGA